MRLELDRDHEFANGSKDRGYKFAAPPDENGLLVAEEWHKASERCRVKRFWPRAERMKLADLCTVEGDMGV
jgi:hypothetical protein